MSHIPLNIMEDYIKYCNKILIKTECPLTHNFKFSIIVIKCFIDLDLDTLNWQNNYTNNTGVIQLLKNTYQYIATEYELKGNYRTQKTVEHMYLQR